MDEEKEQKDGLMKKAGGMVANQAKKYTKKLAKEAAQKIIKKIIMTVLPVLLKFLIPIIAAIILSASIAKILDKMTGEASKEANAFAVYDMSGEKTTSPNRIVVDLNKTGAYELSYEYEKEDGTTIIGNDALDKIKQDLLEKNSKLDLTKFSDSELKVIGALMYNGLYVADYNEEELKALAIFVKVGIAGENFDLRTTDEEITIDDLKDNDEVFGIIQVQRTLVQEESDGNVKYNPVKLQYVPYGDEATAGTFCYMYEQKDLDIVNKFSVNAEGNLVVAKWGATRVENKYLDKNKNELSAEDMKKIPEDKVKEAITDQKYITIDKIDYKQFISQYVLNYGVLSDLLITTKNPEFCLDLAEIALNSKIVININEELTTMVTENTTDYVQTTLLYDYVKYEVSGKKEVTTEGWVGILEGSGSPNASQTLINTYGWSESLPRTRTGEFGESYIYDEWTKGDKTYYLKHINGSTYKYWNLYEKQQVTTYIDLATEPASPDSVELIKIDESKDYTAEEIFEYTIVTKTTSLTNKYNLEISEVDCWYMKYNKEYNTPTKEETTENTTGSTTGEYPENPTTILETTDKTQIENDEHVQTFITTRKNKYKTDYPEAVEETIECDVTYLKVDQKVKTDSQSNLTRTTTIYKFGEEADTTKVTYKNVEYVNNVPSFTEDGEKGFLYVYNQYRQSGVDLYLQDDSEKSLFELLESDNTTATTSDVIKYVLYVYDGVDRGVTELDVSIIEINQFKNGAYASGDVPLYNSLLTRDEFLQAMQEFSDAGAQGLKANFDKYFLSRADEIYSLGEKYEINPELVVVFAWKEQGFRDPVGDESNFWGLAVPNGQTYSPSFGTFEGGVAKLAEVFHSYKAGTGNWQEELILKRYDERYEYNPNGCGLPGTLRGTMSVYTCWLSESRNYHEEGDSGTGGRYYLRETYGEEYEAKCGSVHQDGEPYTIQEFADTAACAYEQVIEKWETIFGKYATLSVISGGITTQEEADELTEQYNQMLNTVVHSGDYYMQSGPFPKWWTSEYSGGLSAFQCTWWAYGRASMYLEENGTIYTKYPSAAQHGGGYYRENVEMGWFNYGDVPKPNSLVCWGKGVDGAYGHVAYVEGVTEEGIWVSHAGSGSTWRGVTFYKNGISSKYGSPNGYIYLDEPL